MTDAQPPLEPTFAPWEDPQATPLIQCKGLKKQFSNGFVAVDVDELTVFKGEFFALLGPSGSGKSTLMRMLGGFAEPSAGTIVIDGQDMAGIPANQREVNMMFQSYALFPHLTVEQNIAFGLKRSSMPPSQIGDRVAEMLRLVQLTPLARRKPDQLSGGQKQRVALARSLAKAPKLLLLDEPLGALDKKLRQETQLELVDIQEKTGSTFFIVTHDQEEAMTMASRVAVMNNGRFEQVGTPDQVYEQPANAYVADFVGEVNLIPGKLDKASSTVVAGALNLKGELRHADMSDASDCCIAIRPEKIRVSKDRPEGELNRLSGKIIDLAYLGNLTTYHVEVEGGHLVRAQIANTSRQERRAFTWGDEVWLSCSLTAGLILDKAS